MLIASTFIFASQSYLSKLAISGSVLKSLLELCLWKRPAQHLPFLNGSFVRIFSDHKPLQHLSTMVNDNKRLMRWVGTLQQFPHEIKYVPGKENIVADSLSRAWDTSPPWGPLQINSKIFTSTSYGISFKLCSRIACFSFC